MNCRCICKNVGWVIWMSAQPSEHSLVRESRHVTDVQPAHIRVEAVRQQGPRAAATGVSVRNMPAQQQFVTSCAVTRVRKTEGNSLPFKSPSWQSADISWTVCTGTDPEVCAFRHRHRCSGHCVVATKTSVWAQIADIFAPADITRLAIRHIARYTGF